MKKLLLIGKLNYLRKKHFRCKSMFNHETPNIEKATKTKLLIGVFLACFLSSAHAEKFSNAASSFCLDTDGAAKNGAQVRAWQCVKHPNQTWLIKNLSETTIQLINERTKFCLDTDGSKRNGGKVRMWECANHPNQIWEVISLANNRLRFKNKASGYCLDTDGKAVNGGAIRTWECVEHPNQMWSMLSPEPASSNHVGTTRQPLILGQPTFERPEIGRLSFGCTGAVVAPRLVMTAAHCINYKNTNVSGQFIFHVKNDTGISQQSIGLVDGYSLGDNLGATDVAFIRLKDPFPASVSRPARIVANKRLFASAQYAKLYGYGCTDRKSKSGGGTKQVYRVPMGSITGSLCPGDSGGPVVLERYDEKTKATIGEIFGINSGYYTGSGKDIFADAVYGGFPVLNALTRLRSITYSNKPASNWAQWAATPGAQIVVGDFDGDRDDDLAMTGPNGWQSIPLALSNRDGSYEIKNIISKDATKWAQFSATPGVKVVAADFDGDGDDDLAMFGATGWSSIPIALSNRNGQFTLVNRVEPDKAQWNQWASLPGVQVIAGDFDGDGYADLLMTGPKGWKTIPVAFSNGNGTFRVTNQQSRTTEEFARVGANLGAKLVVGEFDGQNDRSEFTIIAPGMFEIFTYAMNKNGDASIIKSVRLTQAGNSDDTLTNTWDQWLARREVNTLAGDFDGDGKTDIALMGPSGWRSIPFAFFGSSKGVIGNFPVSDIPQLAATKGVRVLSGKFEGPDKPFGFVLTGPRGWNTLPLVSITSCFERGIPKPGTKTAPDYIC